VASSRAGGKAAKSSATRRKHCTRQRGSFSPSTASSTPEEDRIGGQRTGGGVSAGEVRRGVAGVV
jgi:hypothetical protein